MIDVPGRAASAVDHLQPWTIGGGRTGRGVAHGRAATPCASCRRGRDRAGAARRLNQLPHATAWTCCRCTARWTPAIRTPPWRRGHAASSSSPPTSPRRRSRCRRLDRDRQRPAQGRALRRRARRGQPDARAHHRGLRGSTGRPRRAARSRSGASGCGTNAIACGRIGSRRCSASTWPGRCCRSWLGRRPALVRVVRAAVGRSPGDGTGAARTPGRGAGRPRHRGQAQLCGDCRCIRDSGASCVEGHGSFEAAAACAWLSEPSRFERGGQSTHVRPAADHRRVAAHAAPLKRVADNLERSAGDRARRRTSARHIDETALQARCAGGLSGSRGQAPANRRRPRHAGDRTRRGDRTRKRRRRRRVADRRWT